jgi:hypothetical protein
MPPGSPRCRATGSGARDAKLRRARSRRCPAPQLRRGKRDGNPWGEALALLRTPSGQPFYLNLHSSPEARTRRTRSCPGNTLIIGSTGVGKTTLEMFLLTLTRKWDPAPRLVLFDLDRGCEIAMRALGGRYFALEAGKPTGCNPLQCEPTPARIQFWEQLIRTCIATLACRCCRGRTRHRHAVGRGLMPAHCAASRPCGRTCQGRREQPLRAAGPLVRRRRARLGSTRPTTGSAISTARP